MGLVNTCSKCGGIGIWETGNNDLPCDCPAGDTALFNEAGVEGVVTGAEIRRHFFNNSPEPISGPIKAEDLPGRRQTRKETATESPPPKNHEEFVGRARTRLARFMRRSDAFAWSAHPFYGEVKDVVLVLLDEIDKLHAEIARLRSDVSVTRENDEHSG